MKIHLGLDVGSTTVKFAALSETLEVLASSYERHFSDVRETVRRGIEDLLPRFRDEDVTVSVTGSGGIAVHEATGIPFVQEVIAGTKAIEKLIPETDIAIELGGEDSKITYLRGAIEQRMNSICAGGTGAFIDQMAALLKTDASGLNELAKKYKRIYPIASRCGVFAKTDIQALINQGASQADVAASVFQAVVNQTISNLACGRPLCGRIAFLGGPLHFLSELKQRFAETLELQEDEIIAPADGQLYVAYGAALASRDTEAIPYTELYRRVQEVNPITIDEDKLLPPLFTSQEELAEFRRRHARYDFPKREIATYAGPVYVGIDAGSTTTKIIAMTEELEVLYEAYGSNRGTPLEIVRDYLLDLYEKLNPEAYIAAAGVTGYGEDLIKAAFKADCGEVETIVHLKAARHFEPDVDFVLDIGGQDMKAMKVEDDVISSILLNEACSAGCGSFLETFAKSVNYTVQEFSEAALFASRPVDLGSRCTVFMNSKVKQAQKEGATVEDISAGLAYSVIKNALQKVIKVRDPKSLGKHIVVQGGTFYGDAVLRAFEQLSGREVVRPAMAGTMGAIGMALTAKESGTEYSSLLKPDALREFSYETENANCGRCSNQCRLTISTFSSGEKYISGNRCERGAGIVRAPKDRLPNLYKYKENRVFRYRSLSPAKATRGTVGLPRVLNMYENYPFWHTFFTELGYRVVLSDRSSRQIYEKGIASIPSETACYPAKMVHGHIENLIEKNVDFIFYPSVFYEEKKYKQAQNTLNCPVVIGYPEVIKNNVENLRKTRFVHMFLSFDHRQGLVKRLADEFSDLPYTEVRHAVEAAYEAQDIYRADVRAEGRRALKEIRERGILGIVLAGRPYHVDSEINHGIPELINSLGLAVLSEDSILDDGDLDEELTVLDQWNYHSRLYRAAKIVGTDDNLEMVQLNSFGCGLDAITTDQVDDILAAYHKIHTVLKIDEINNLGAARIRLRSLIHAVKKRRVQADPEPISMPPRMFTKEMEKTYTILAPQMAPLQFNLLAAVLKEENVNIELLPPPSPEALNEGLKYTNNDACYPAILVVGQFINAVKSGKYDNDHLALIMSQTGGPCRASNYVGFIRRALLAAGYGHIPVIAASKSDIETHPGINFSFPKKLRIGKKAVHAVLYGDLLMRLSNAVRPYALNKNDVEKLVAHWERLTESGLKYKRSEFRRNIRRMIADFENVPVDNQVRPRVGIVGEIFVKYFPAANNHLQATLEAEGAEVVIPDLADFILYGLTDSEFQYRSLSRGIMPMLVDSILIGYIESYRDIMREELAPSRFEAPSSIRELMTTAQEFVSLGHQYGEGWLLIADMIELIRSGVANIVCVQPFGCLPNHITGKGMIKAIRERYPLANIVPLDYDASASEVNQLNRIKLMLSVAEKNKYKNNHCPDELPLRRHSSSYLGNQRERPHYGQS